MEDQEKSYEEGTRDSNYISDTVLEVREENGWG